MDKTILSIGLMFVVIGMFLVIAFWPVFGVSGSELHSDREDGIYESYEEGDEVWVYGTLTNVTFETERLPEWMRDLMEELDVDDFAYVEIDDEFELVVEGEESLDFDEGDQVYGRLNLRKEEAIFVEWEYWELDGDLSSKRLIDFTFYGITGIGLATIAVSALRD